MNQTPPPSTRVRALKSWLPYALLCLSTLNPPLSTFAQGSLTPPGAPAPSFKTLTQIEPRTPISAAPFTISTAGSYYLTTNLTVSSGTAITIAANGVTLDLSGFTIASTAPSAAGYGIQLNTGLRNITVQNGFIQGGVTNNGGTNVYAGSGFANGISYSGTAPLNARVSGISVLGCLTAGINVGFGDASIAESCCVHTVGNRGISASTIKNSVATDCGEIAINGDQVSDCRGESTGGTGVWGEVVTNSRGISTSTGAGDYGIRSTVVNNSAAQHTGGTAILATVANGCYATAGTNIITYKYNMP